MWLFYSCCMHFFEKVVVVFMQPGSAFELGELAICLHALPLSLIMRFSILFLCFVT